MIEELKDVLTDEQGLAGASWAEFDALTVRRATLDRLFAVVEAAANPALTGRLSSPQEWAVLEAALSHMRDKA
jgi:hypothetical protein